MADKTNEGTQKKIIFFVSSNCWLPLFLKISRHLNSYGIKTLFVTFTFIVNLEIKKNKITPYPPDIDSIKNYPIKDALLSEEEIKEIIYFEKLRAGSEFAFFKNRVLTTASFLSDLIQKEKPIAVLVWNGEDLLGKILIELAKKEHLITIFAENGYFKDTLQIDNSGVNIKSSVAALSLETMKELTSKIKNSKLEKENADIALTIPKIIHLSIVDLIYCFLKRKLNINFYKDFPELRGTTWFKNKRFELLRKLIKKDTVTLPERFIFIPLQVHDDTQVVLNSKFFKNMEDLIEFCHHSIVNKFGSEYKIVVKEHPEDLCRKSYSKIRGKYPDILWLRKFDLNLLLEKASFVIVLNSSVGLQALEKYKPVIALADSLYSKNEVLLKLNSLAEMERLLSEATKGLSQERRENIDILIEYLKSAYFIKGHWKSFDNSTILSSAKRMLNFLRII